MGKSDKNKTKDKAYFSEQNYADAYKWKCAAQQGFPKAQNILGYYYAVGDIVKQDYKEAIKWFRLAADQGYAPAQYNLGCCYRDGYGAEQSDEEAAKWFKMAADQGHEGARLNIERSKKA